MRERTTNAGKKEQRQIDQLLTKAAKQGRTGTGKDVEARTVPKHHRLRGQKGK